MTEKTQVNRRGFIGALAAAPVMASAMAKDVAGSSALGVQGISRGVSMTLSLQPFVLEGSIGAARPITVTPEARWAMERTLAGENPDAVVVIPRSNLDLDDAELEWRDLARAAPNRLFGAYLNADGDAV